MENTAYVVSAMVGSSRMAVSVFTDDGTEEVMARAANSARRYQGRGWREVKLRMAHGKEEVERAEMQVERIEDWASDYDL